MFRFKRSVALLMLVAVLLAAMPVTAQAQTPDTSTDLQVLDNYEYYGRSVLENTQNTALLYAYDQLVKGVENAESSISVYDGLAPITVDELRLVMDLYRRDYAHHFWLDNSYGISYNS